MAKYYSIASGSKGNCGLLITKDKKILIDMGISFKYLTESLAKYNFDINDIDFVLITHEHIDHVRGIPMLGKKTNIPIYISEKSFNNCKEKSKIITDNIIFFKPNETINVNDIKVEIFKIPHDSAECVSFKIFFEDFSFSYATDLGFMPENVLNAIKTSNMVVLESNYDLDMLENNENYPYITKERIKSNEGHLSNVEASLCVKTLIENGVCQILLAHLSENNNSPANVKAQMENSFKFYGIKAEFGKNIHIAPIKNEYPIINF